MSTTLTINGVGYPFPAVGESPWGQKIINWATAATAGLLQKSGGAFTLTADVDFGANFGILSAYYASRNASPASAGQIRLGNTETIKWRDVADAADLDLTVNASDQLAFNGIVIGTPVSGDVVGPAGATDGAPVLFDGTTGKLLKEGTTPKRRATYCVGFGTPSAAVTVTADRIIGMNDVAAPGSGDGNYMSFVPNRAGSIIGYGVSAFITGWVATEEWHGRFQIRLNGSRVIASSDYDHTSGTNVTQLFNGTVASGTHTFAAGDVIQLEMDFDSAVGSVSHAVMGHVEVEYDT